MEIGEPAAVSVDEPSSDAENDDPGEGPAWLRLVLIDQHGQPVAGARYRVIDPTGRARWGRLDAEGKALVQGLEAGECDVVFVEYAKWEPA